MLTQTSVDIKKVLKKFFGYSTFRGRQEEIIRSILEGRDALVIMPTGAGKSLCYQLPAIVSEGCALVISPLIALMKNQVDQMMALGIDAGFLNSSMSRGDYEAVKARAINGTLKLLYVAPETLVRDEFMEFLKLARISFVAVDEAHCISEWGHDFRPEYRRIRIILSQLGPVPFVALTATATPKVQQDIIETLRIEQAQVYKTSFNRTNLYYEIRPKVNPIQEIVKYVKQTNGQSGIVYCLSRRKVEEMAEILNVNGVKAVPYHAGLDSEVRNRHQDMFLNEQVQVVVATIAFGMGIDKPDVRFVIHYDVPKSIESYYQETGRAGRDGLEGNCVLFYQFNDIVKLEKFMKDKSVSERDAARHLLFEMASFCESGMCRRKMLLHYFGELFDEKLCNHMCDNCRNPKEMFDATREALMAVQVVQMTAGKFPMNYLVSVLQGSSTAQIKSMGHDKLSVFGQGAHFDEKEWKSVFTQLIVRDYLLKDIADYGVIKLGDQGAGYLENPENIHLVKYQDFEKVETEQHEGEDFKIYDEVLLGLLHDIREKVAKKEDLPPYVIFSEPALQEMATKYPITLAEFETISGVNPNKARKFGPPFLAAIKTYVEANEIERPTDIVVKTKGKNSAEKLYIIQQIDRKISLHDIADQRGIKYAEILDKIYHIVHSGSKLSLDYFVEQEIDPDTEEEIYDYFRQSKTDDLDVAQKYFGKDTSVEELMLMRIKFYSDMAN
jgi:ATP-dependent DNA helicase RecQ